MGRHGHAELSCSFDEPAGRNQDREIELAAHPRSSRKQELVQDCRGGGWCFPKTIERPRAVHFCGRKPFLLDYKAYSKPFTIARLEHYRKQQGNSSAWRAVLNE